MIDGAELIYPLSKGGELIARVKAGTLPPHASLRILLERDRLSISVDETVYGLIEDISPKTAARICACGGAAVVEVLEDGTVAGLHPATISRVRRSGDGGPNARPLDGKAGKSLGRRAGDKGKAA